MKRIEAFGTPKDGKLIISKRDSFWDSFRFKFKDGERLKITIEKVYKKRSNSQNRYYWGVVVPLVKDGLYEVGYVEVETMTNEDIHEYLKNLCFTEDMKAEIRELSGSEFTLTSKETGEIMPVDILTTTKLTTTLYMVYLENIKRFAAEYLGVSIPDPGEQIEFEFEK